MIQDGVIRDHGDALERLETLRPELIAETREAYQELHGAGLIDTIIKEYGHEFHDETRVPVKAAAIAAIGTDRYDANLYENGQLTPAARAAYAIFDDDKDEMMDVSAHPACARE